MRQWLWEAPAKRKTDEVGVHQSPVAAESTETTRVAKKAKLETGSSEAELRELQEEKIRDWRGIQLLITYFVGPGYQNPLSLPFTDLPTDTWSYGCHVRFHG